MNKTVPSVLLLVLLTVVAACASAPAAPSAAVPPPASQTAKQAPAVAPPTEKPAVAPAAEKPAASAATQAAPVAGKAAPAPAVVKPTGELVIATPLDINCWSPYHCGALPVQDLVTERLLRWDKDVKLAPMLATSWKLIDDTTWELKLREGVKFSNGEAFNAEAVKLNFDPFVNNDPIVQPTVKASFRSVKRVDAVDPTTVRFIMHEPDPLLLNYLAYEPRMVPPKYFKEVGDEVFGKKPIGTGPFILKEWVASQHLLLEANPTYWGKTPPMERIKMRIIPETTTRMAELLAGGIHIVEGLTGDSLAQIQKSNVARVESVPRTSVIYVHLRPEDKLTNLALREAFMLATDTELIIETVMGGLANKLTRGACLTPWEFGYDESIPEWKYNPEKAKQKLKEANYDGRELVFTYRAGFTPNADEVAEALQAMWGEVGLKIKLNREETGVWNKNWDNRTPSGDIFMSSTAAKAMDSDARLTPSVHSWNKETGMGRVSFFNDPEIDKLIDQSRQIMDPVKRKAVLIKTWTLHSAAAHHLPLYYPDNVWGISNKIEWQPTIDHQWSDLLDMRWK